MPTDGPADPEIILGDSDTGPSSVASRARRARVRAGVRRPVGPFIRSPGTSGDYRVRVALLQLWADGVSERIWCGVSSLNGQDALGVNGLGDLGQLARGAVSRGGKGVAVARQAGIWQPLAPAIDDLAANAVARQPPASELAPRSP